MHVICALARSSCGDVVMCYGFMDDVIFAYKPRLLDVAAQLKRSAHAALGLAINCAVIPAAGQWTHGTTFQALKVTSQVAAPGAESAIYDCLVDGCAVINHSVSVCVCVCSKSQPSSAENTINRPRQTQSGPGHPNTLHVDRGQHQPPPYTSNTSLTNAPHGGTTYSLIAGVSIDGSITNHNIRSAVLPQILKVWVQLSMI